MAPFNHARVAGLVMPSDLMVASSASAAAVSGTGTARPHASISSQKCAYVGATPVPRQARPTRHAHSDRSAPPSGTELVLLAPSLPPLPPLLLLLLLLLLLWLLSLQDSPPVSKEE